MLRETARLFRQPGLPQHFAVGRLSAGRALNADRIGQVADFGGVRGRLGHEPPLQFVVGAHGDIDVWVRVLALHVTAILWRVWRGGMRFAV
jgi:hypothetical protein